MHQNPGDLAALAIAALLLLGAHLAEHDRIDRFQMRRVGGQRQMHVLPVDCAVRRGAEMVFDITRAMDVLGIAGMALELREDRGIGLADNISEHVQPAAMRHADHEFLDPEGGAAAQNRLQCRH